MLNQYSKKRRKNIAFDVDDTIVPFTELVLNEIGEDPTSKVEWGFKNFEPEVREKAFKLFTNKEFISNIPILEKNKLIPFIKDLSKEHNVFFVTAIYPEVATERILYLQKHFPFIPSGNIITAGNKEIFDFDIFFDDRFENLAGDSKYNILINKSWNSGFTRFPIVRSLDEMIDITYKILSGEYTKSEIFNEYKSTNIDDNSIVLIQGHTGAGKNTVIKKYFELFPDTNLKKVKTTTTRRRRPNETKDDYNFVSKTTFLRKLQANEFIEYTIYNGDYYGTEKREIDKVYKENKRPLVIVDKYGIEAFNNYDNNIIDIYIKRDIIDTINGLYKRDGNLNRIYQLNKEIKNIDIHKCRYEIVNNGDPAKAASLIDKYINTI